MTTYQGFLQHHSRSRDAVVASDPDRLDDLLRRADTGNLHLLALQEACERADFGEFLERRT